MEFTATFEALRGPELTCTLRAKVGEWLVATGRTRQRIVPVGRLPQPPNSTFRP